MRINWLFHHNLKFRPNNINRFHGGGILIGLLHNWLFGLETVFRLTIAEIFSGLQATILCWEVDEKLGESKRKPGTNEQIQRLTL